MAESAEWVDLSPGNVASQLKSYCEEIWSSQGVKGYLNPGEIVTNQLMASYELRYYALKTYAQQGLKTEDECFEELRHLRDDLKAKVYAAAVEKGKQWIAAHPDAVKTIIREKVLAVPGATKAEMAGVLDVDAVVDGGYVTAVNAGSIPKGIEAAVSKTRSIVGSYLQSHPGSAIAVAIESGVPVETFTRLPPSVSLEQVARLVANIVAQQVSGIVSNITWEQLTAFRAMQTQLSMIANNVAASAAYTIQQLSVAQQQIALQERLQAEYEAIRVSLEEYARKQAEAAGAQQNLDTQRNDLLKLIADMSGKQAEAIANLQGLGEWLVSSSEKTDLLLLGVVNPYKKMLDILTDPEYNIAAIERKDGKYVWSPGGKPLRDYVEHPVETLEKVKQQAGSTRLGDRFGVADYVGKTTEGALDGAFKAVADVLEAVTLGQIKKAPDSNTLEFATSPVSGPWEHDQAQAIGKTLAYIGMMMFSNWGIRILDAIVRMLTFHSVDVLGEIWRDLMWALGLPWMSWAISSPKIRAAIVNHLEAIENYHFRSRYPTISEAGDMYASGYVDKDMYLTLLRFNGIPEWQEEYYLVAPFKDIPLESVKKLLLKRKIQVDEAYARLRMLKYSDHDARMIIASWLEEAKEKLAEKMISRIEDLFKAGQLDEGEALSMLRDCLDGDDEMARSYLRLWEVDMSIQRRKNLSESWIERLWRDKVLTDDQALQRLTMIGYDPDDAKLILDYWRTHKK